ncbi:hypothetical protein B0H17DRAFT_1145517 [Mycena rosella]|uniref:Uncharacterized protein n=1 Tax=Mycena rosella TaxID=1033263 RepID=A0AAD7CQV8_MYCRO|nr:hypothetical protein B0H17DRAFT_1145517 [Mycena rosella]
MVLGYITYAESQGRFWDPISARHGYRQALVRRRNNEGPRTPRQGLDRRVPKDERRYRLMDADDIAEGQEAYPVICASATELGKQETSASWGGICSFKVCEGAPVMRRQRRRTNADDVGDVGVASAQNASSARWWLQHNSRDVNFSTRHARWTSALGVRRGLQRKCVTDWGDGGWRRYAYSNAQERGNEIYCRGATKLEYMCSVMLGAASSVSERGIDEPWELGTHPGSVLRIPGAEGAAAHH